MNLELKVKTSGQEQYIVKTSSTEQGENHMKDNLYIPNEPK